MANRAVLVVGTFFLALLAIFLSSRILSTTSPSSYSSFSDPICEVPGDLHKDDLVILTASNEYFFDRMVNLIGSVHYWEPNLKVVAYDLGLTPSQVKIVKRMCNTEYKRFEFEKYPPYMKQLRFFAWKPIIINETLRNHRTVFWQDSGQEFRAPITEIKEFIQSDGYFFDQSDANFNHFCPQVMYDALGIPDEKSKFTGLAGLHAATLGFRKGSRAYRKVLQPAVNCSLSEACVAPYGTDLSNYRYDQSLLSLFAYKNGPYLIRKDKKFIACTLGICPEFDPIRDSPDPDFQQVERLVLFSRRGFPVKPYADKVCYLPITPEDQAEDLQLTQEQGALYSKAIAVEREVMRAPPTLTLPKETTMKNLAQKNRQILSSVPKWLTAEVYKNSRALYGIPNTIKDLIDAPVGDEITISDVLTYIATKEMGGKGLKYLEVGASVGKTFVQMASSMSESTLATIELEAINPTLESMFTEKRLVSSWRYYSPFQAPRMMNDSCTTYKSSLGGNTNEIIYVSGDVRDENAWNAIKGHQFNIIFSDAVQDPTSITKEMEFITKFDLLDRDNFLIWYDDLGGLLAENATMAKAFVSNFFALQKKFPFLDASKNLGAVLTGGWIGMNEWKHLSGIISSLNVQELIKTLTAV